VIERVNAVAELGHVANRPLDVQVVVSDEDDPDDLR
jgi:hypothetical protein